jgi:hypothetical protein
MDIIIGILVQIDVGDYAGDDIGGRGEKERGRIVKNRVKRQRVER